MNRMKRSLRDKNKHTTWFVLLFWVAVTAGLGLVGPAMALWGDNLYIDESVGTGEVDARFINPKSFDVVSEGGGEYPQLSIPTYKNEFIKFKIRQAGEGDLYKLTFTVYNDGTVPIRINKQLNPDIDKYWGKKIISIEGFNVSNNFIIYPQQSETCEILIRQKIGWLIGFYGCEIPIEIVRWNGDFSGGSNWWKETLLIEGDLGA